MVVSAVAVGLEHLPEAQEAARVAVEVQSGLCLKGWLEEQPVTTQQEKEEETVEGDKPQTNGAGSSSSVELVEGVEVVVLDMV